MEKTDLTKLHKSYYTAKKIPEIINFETVQYLAITGKGDPSGKEFSDNIAALYATAYAVKFICKAAQNDFVVAKLEGLWWYDENKFGNLSIVEAPQKVKRSDWEYRLLLRMPDFVTPEIVHKAIVSMIEKKSSPNIQNVHLFNLNEGKCVQILHIGPFDKEPETLMLINEFTTLNNLARNGLHHEIYLSDFRKTAPEKLKTILREPVA